MDADDDVFNELGQPRVLVFTLAVLALLVLACVGWWLHSTDDAMDVFTSRPTMMPTFVVTAHDPGIGPSYPNAPITSPGTPDPRLTIAPARHP